MKTKYIFFLLGILLSSNSIMGQEILPVYTDYLTDNIYLLHPAGAGVSNYGKIRLTGRKQWLNYDNAPELQTLSIHSHLGNNSALGVVAFNDKNGHYSMAGGEITYAYHISLNNRQTNQFSFAISALAIRNTLNASDFNLQDSDINAQIYNTNYFNTDVGIAYRNKGLFSFFTIKNLLNTKEKMFDHSEGKINLRRHLATIGFQFNQYDEDSVKIQPSIMGQYIEQTKEISIDTNLKVSVPFNNGDIWGGISYRKGFGNTTMESPNYLTPFLGINYKKYILSYSHTNQQNNTVYSKAGFHQITLGYNFSLSRFDRKATWDL